MLSFQEYRLFFVFQKSFLCSHDVTDPIKISNDQKLKFMLSILDFMIQLSVHKRHLFS